MKFYLDTSYKYIKYYTSRSFSIMLSMMLSIALIVGIGTLSQSAKQADVEKMKYENGSNHVWFEDIKYRQYNLMSECKDVGKIGLVQYYDSAVNHPINLLRADKNYIELCDSKIIKGRMPNKENEIVLESWVISNLGLKGKLGEQITFDLSEKNKKETYTLVGIIQDRFYEKSTGVIEGLLSIKGITTGNFKTYIKFNNNINITSAISKMQEKCSLKPEKIHKNIYLLDAMDAVNKLDDNFTITIMIISIFAGMVIYSIFNISVLQRISEYGTLKAIGAKPIQIFKFIYAELFLLCLISIPLGTLMGYFGAEAFSSFAGQLFTEGEVRISTIILSVKAVLFSVILLIFTITIIASIMAIRVKKISSISAITKNFGNSNLRKSAKAKFIAKLFSFNQVISYKNLMRDKKSFFITIITIAMGGVIFIVANFSTNLEKMDIKTSMALDPTINSDFKISSGIMDTKTAVTDKEIKLISKLEGIKNVDPIQVKFGGVVIPKDKVVFPDFFDIENKSDFYANVLNGVFTKIKNTDNYLLKNCIYGYNDKLIKELKPYLLEGDINIEKMKNKDVILLRMPRGGKRDYEFNIKPGDKITEKFLLNTENNNETVKMPDNLKYIEKEFIVGGILSDVTTSCDYYADDTAEIILSNKKFEEIMNYSNYSIVNVFTKKNADHIKINAEISDIVSNIPGCTVRDMVSEIGELKSYNNQKIGYVYTITLILFIIGLFNIMNNISYSLIARISEFSLIRAIGLDNKGFKRMILFEGLIYGLSSSIITIIGSVVAQRIYFHMIRNNYSNPNFTINYKLYILMTLVNVLIGLFATYIPSRRIKDFSIMESINNKE